MQDELHDGLPEVLDLVNMAGGGVYEMTSDALKELAANIADPNTDARQKRTVYLKIEAKPYKDRSGAELTVKVEKKFAGRTAIESMMYVALRAGEYLPFGRNTKQTEIEFADTVDHSGGATSGTAATPKKVN